MDHVFGVVFIPQLPVVLLQDGHDEGEKNVGHDEGEGGGAHSMGDCLRNALYFVDGAR